MNFMKRKEKGNICRMPINRADALIMPLEV
jgi:hypothetical protein